MLTYRKYRIVVFQKHVLNKVWDHVVKTAIYCGEKSMKHNNKPMDIFKRICVLASSKRM